MRETTKTRWTRRAAAISAALGVAMARATDLDPNVVAPETDPNVVQPRTDPNVVEPKTDPKAPRPVEVAPKNQRPYGVPGGPFFPGAPYRGQLPPGEEQAPPATAKPPERDAAKGAQGQRAPEKEAPKDAAPAESKRSEDAKSKGGTMIVPGGGVVR